MHVAQLTIEYDGKAWFCHWETDPSAHSLGVSASRAVRVVRGPATDALDIPTAMEMHEALYDLADQLVSQLSGDIIDDAHDVPLSLFDTVLEGKLAP